MSINDLIYSRKLWVVRHLAFWLIMYLDEFLSFFGITEEMNIGFLVIALSLDFFMVYFNFYYLIPKFFEKGKIATYVLCTLTTIIFNVNISLFKTTFLYPCEECSWFVAFFSTSMFSSGLLGVALAIKLSKTNYFKQQRFNELQQFQLSVELNNLKKQVNPHFLFNILNGMYVQSRENPKDVPEMILKLSELMRYQTYDANKKAVRLNQEIDFLQKYLDFEKMRRDHLQIDVQLEGNMNNISVPPLLVLPFVENACKHSALVNGKDEYIRVKWHHKENDLVFKMENTIGKRDGHLNDDRYSGFGLNNIKKRIQLLYPGEHHLSIKEEDGLYKVELIIEGIG